LEVQPKKIFGAICKGNADFLVGFETLLEYDESIFQ
jgi:hypothetical protein